MLGNWLAAAATAVSVAFATPAGAHDVNVPPSSYLSAAAPQVSAAPALIAAAAALSGKSGAPPIRHVFILILENQSYGVTFGENTPAPFLAQTLPAQGALLRNYYAIGHSSLDNYVALISGQAPNPQTQSDCPVVTEFQMTQPVLDAEGQAPGAGCLYPALVKNLADQLEAAGFSWKGYMEDMGNDSARESATCGHSSSGAQEKSYVATALDKYAARHDPFVYFHAIIDDAHRCETHVVKLDELQSDLRRADSTPNFAFITPNLCNDGHDPTCVDGKLGGLQATEAFLRTWVPRITASPAFRQDGLLIVTFDESDSIGPEASTACCGEKPLPGSPQQPGYSGPGGGRVGAVLISPFIRPGTVSAVPYNHYSTLRTIEDQFGVEHLGYAGQSGLKPFGRDVFTRMPKQQGAPPR